MLDYAAHMSSIQAKYFNRDEEGKSSAKMRCGVQVGGAPGVRSHRHRAKMPFVLPIHNLVYCQLLLACFERCPKIPFDLPIRACHRGPCPGPRPRSTLETHSKPLQRTALHAQVAGPRGAAASRRWDSGGAFPETPRQKYRLIYLSA